jgi:hypothetical protein
MGNESKCTVRFGKDVSEGNALLETSEILFRGEFRLKIPFSTIKSAKAVDPEWIFFAADSKLDLGGLSKISKSMRGAASLWIVYPKGQKHITENDVLAAGRECGLKDVKVVGFSSTHTALKFVIPLAQRQ